MKDCNECIKHNRKPNAVGCIECSNMKGKRKMKYIRTKDGIYELKGNIFGDLIRVVGLDEFHKNNYKQSESVEELCDEFVWDKSIIRFRPDKKHFSYANDDFLFELDNDIIKEGIYGAIWTEWGLKYTIKAKDILPNGEIDWEVLYE